jgi:arginine utilization regulatory protein
MLTRYLQHCEREIIKHTIEKYEGNMSEAARQLKISRQLLKYKIEKYL